MNTQEVKGTLAKLLATENLTVEHRKVSTACFDVDSRTLILPIWKTASNTVYDLLVGHEVGHALYTPNEDFGGAAKAFVNVLEDARIEKLMKIAYPGLRKSFFEGYKELWDADFFGVKHEKISELSLIDRINLYFKGNPQVPFLEDEQIWVERAGNTKNFQEVIALAKELWEYANEKQEEKEEILEPLSTNGSRQADRQEKIDISSENGEEEDEYMTHEEMLEEASKREREHSDLETPSYQGGADETKSVTDDSLTEALETLIDDNAKEWIYLTTPTIDVNDHITSYNEVQENLYFYYHGKAFHNADQQEYHFKNFDYALNHYENFKRDTKKTVGYLCKQFEMRKSADEYRRTATAKTGVIDTNKLFKYKLTEDIFKKVTVIPEGKNHGLVMHIDWSGSMQYQLLDTLKQVYNLIWFCKKSGIPFRVYAFQSGSYGSYSRIQDDIRQNENELGITRDFRLLEFFSSRQNTKSLEKSMQLVYAQAFGMVGCRLGYLQEYGLGGTPLAEAVYCTRQIVSQMKKIERVAKVNVVCLTDGEANPMSYIQSMTDVDVLRHVYMCHQRHKVFFLRDSLTGYTRKINSSPYETTKEIVSFYREITDYNWIGIRICSKIELTRLIREFAIEQMGTIDKQWRKEKFASVKDKIGFTESFFMPDKGMGDDMKELEVKQKSEVATKAELTRAFKKHMGSKMTNKTILNAFIEQIA
ncbi:peptidase [Synechococcus phage ACG-2014g]|jgi:hypothetical protein|uniref:Peptidase n=1 Tax=Synechococcus phage ACG-2014g TaxID=1493512 RepID=A0A0E3HG53_9CAUD|nr:peptidase [Synechococcus phage ACG-2014g]AIX24473.1 peptidase [Synechococcus phage ACG-2014g]